MKQLRNIKRYLQANDLWDAYQAMPLAITAATLLMTWIYG